MLKRGLNLARVNLRKNAETCGIGGEIYTSDHIAMQVCCYFELYTVPIIQESLKKLIDAEINPHCAEWEAAGAYPAHEGQYHNELLTKLIND